MLYTSYLTHFVIYFDQKTLVYPCAHPFSHCPVSVAGNVIHTMTPTSFYDQNVSFVVRCCRKLFTFSSSPEPLGQFQKTWHKASLGTGESSLFKRRAPPFFQWEIITKQRKFIDEIKKKYSSLEPLEQFKQKLAQCIIG